MADDQTTTQPAYQIIDHSYDAVVVGAGTIPHEDCRAIRKRPDRQDARCPRP